MTTQPGRSHAPARGALTIHEILTVAGEATCAICGPAPCVCRPGGVHLCRVARARADGILSAEDFACVICDADVYTGTTVVIDPIAVTS